MPRPLENEEWYLNCGPCEVATAMNTPAAAWRAARLPRFRGRMLQFQSFTKHNQSAMHQQTCRVSGGEVMDAPPLEEFEAAWEAAAGSSSAAGTASEIFKRKHKHCNGACPKPSWMLRVKLARRRRRWPYNSMKATCAFWSSTTHATTTLK